MSMFISNGMGCVFYLDLINLLGMGSFLKIPLDLEENVHQRGNAEQHNFAGKIGKLTVILYTCLSKLKMHTMIYMYENSLVISLLVCCILRRVICTGYRG